MSYTHRKVIWERCIVGPDGSIVNAYGDIIRTSQLTCSELTICSNVTYMSVITVLVRKQPKQEVIKTSDGREILSRSIYYVDPSIEPKALQIAKMDLLDGETVESVYVMCDLYNRPRMVRLVTV